MHRILVSCQGDLAVNLPQVTQELFEYTGPEPVVLDLYSQVVSLEDNGILDIIAEYKTKFPHRELWVDTPNRLEDHKLQALGSDNCYSFPVCDQLLLCGKYWTSDPVEAIPGAKRFSYLAGRHSLARCVFSYILETENLSQYFFLSNLQGGGPPSWRRTDIHISGNTIYESPGDWFRKSTDLQKVDEWYDQWQPISVDNQTLQTQYDPNNTTRLNMVKLSKNWYADVVFETATSGDVFFITEKTIRSLIAEKPFIVYAAKNHLAHMRDLGFQTFQSLWNEDYDGKSLRKRHNAIVYLVKQLCAMPEDEFVDLMHQAQSITAHNKSNLKQLCIDYHGTATNWLQKSKKTTIG